MKQLILLTLLISLLSCGGSGKKEDKQVVWKSELKQQIVKLRYDSNLNKVVLAD